WKRARYYPQGSETMDQAVLRETREVRSHVGMMDASTLGKIDIQGEDAATFLDRIYTNAWLKLGVGKCRYGLMLNEHGMVFDDGVTSRLGENHYHMTTTTGGAARVMNWLEEWLQTEWPELNVFCTSVTEQWAVVAINGPQARALLANVTDIDLSNEAFPHMSCRDAEIAGIQGRIFRISFTGELSYEVNVPARYGMHLWESLHRAGSEFGLCTYGTESMHVLRAEKGFIIVGQDTDGTVTPHDLGMSWIVKDSRDFLGRRSLDRSDTHRPGRPQLVGVLTDDPELVLPEGAHLVDRVLPKPPMDTVGHVTSSYMSPNVGRSIAMGLVENGRERIGESLQARLIDGQVIPVTLAEPVFFDPEGVRGNG
ncbi:MAG: aminomethyltransferase family protein, partial [Gammaproteobacteria bacterium]|nr:aminomethyltransferase family protein [Gammaproteobacteria bacterium]